MKEKKEKKKRMANRCLQREQTVATVGKRPRLLAWEGVLEEARLRLRSGRAFGRDRGYLT